MDSISKDTRAKKMFRQAEWLTVKIFQGLGILILATLAAAFISGPYLLWFLTGHEAYDVEDGFAAVGAYVLWFFQGCLILSLGGYLFDKVHSWAHDV